MTTLLTNIINQVKENLENGKKRFEVKVYNKPCIVWVCQGKATLCWRPLSPVLGNRTLRSLEKCSKQLKAVDF